jgi:UPF0755 protein
VRRRGWWLAGAVVVVAGFAGLGAAVAWLEAASRAPDSRHADATRLVTVAPGASVAAIGRALVEAGVVRNLQVFRWAVWRSGAARRLQAGEYRFDRPASAREVVERLARGDVVLWPVTFPEGLSVQEMAVRFEQAGLGSMAEFLEAARADGLVADLDPEARDLEGYLFPDTYALPRGTPAARLVALMVARFREAFGPELRETARARGLSVRAVVTLASLIEKETARPEERALISAVYHNRLRAGMRLQCDPTVIYALLRDGRYTGNLTREDLAVDSPYNTYRYPGLPPGPIAAPGRAALEAAVHPAPVDYLYFVSRNDGSHVFASTLAEHNRNVQRYQVQYFRDARRRARSPRATPRKSAAPPSP